MENFYDYKKFAILYVDDEKKSLNNFARAFGANFRVLTASSAQEGLRVLQKGTEEIGILMTDQRMPGEKGVWLLERARQSHPRALRILVTAYADMDAAIAAVNSGAIYKYVTKPWDPPQLEITFRQGLEFFMVQAERDQLLREKLSVLRNMMIADRIVSLGLLAAGLSHHIRNSLVAVKTFLELAPSKMTEEKANMEGLRDPGFWKEYHHNVQSQIEKINSLLKDLWAASENQPGVEFADMVDLREIVGAALEGLQASFAKRCIEVENHIPDSLPALRADRAKFQRLFELLLKEELTTLPAGARVGLTAELRKGVKPEIVVTLSDNGPGLPQEALRVVFDPFVVRGSVPSEYGIHLMACFFIVHHHGGKIEASSRPGQGTTFTLRLPLQPEGVATTGNEADFLKKALLNENLWETLLTR